jgi:hypothetical protein
LSIDEARWARALFPARAPFFVPLYPDTSIPDTAMESRSPNQHAFYRK